MKIKFEKNGDYGYYWTVTHDDGTEHSYKTDKNGEGLWSWYEGIGQYRQIKGTCQFSLTAKTDAGRKAYIRRHFCKEEAAE